MSNVSNAAIADAPVSVKQALLASAVKSITVSLDSGAEAEASIVDTVKALTFLALDKMGAEMIADGFDIKTTKAFSDPYTMVLKRLINSGKRIYRDSEDSFAEHVKGKKAGERMKGIAAYMKASKSNDLVWTVAEIRNLAGKVIKSTLATDEGREFARSLSTTENEAAAIGDFDTWFGLEFGQTYKQVKGSFTNNAAKEARDAVKSMLKAIEKMDSIEGMEEVAAALAARIKVVKANSAKLDAMVGPAEDEGKYDNVVTLARAA